MRRVEYLIQAAREIGRAEANEDSTVSVKDNTILQYLNDAKTHLQSSFVSKKNVQRIFVKDILLPIVANQESYSIPDRAVLNKQFHLVQYSSNGRDWRTLDKLQIFNRRASVSTEPYGYFISNSKIFLDGIPGSSLGFLRVSYDRVVDNIDKRRARISSVTGLTSTTFTSMALVDVTDSTGFPTLSTIDFICVNDPDGNVTAYNIPVLSFTSGTLTPRAGYTFQAGETIAAGSFVTFHQYSSTHCKLPDECEPYLIYYAAQRILHQESSPDVINENAFLKNLEADILSAYTAQTGEIHLFPRTNFDEF